MKENSMGDKTDDEMKLPEGMNCSDCYAFEHCSRMYGAKAEWTNCDFHPNRFRFSIAKATALKARAEKAEQQRDALADENEMLRGRVHALESDKSGIRFICDKCNGFRELFDSALTPPAPPVKDGPILKPDMYIPRHGDGTPVNYDPAKDNMEEKGGFK